MELKWRSLGQVSATLALLAGGSALWGVAVNGVLIPQGFVSGGFTGLALLLHNQLPWLPVSAGYLLLNLPMYALAWRWVGRRFFVFSLLGLVIFSAAVDWVRVPPLLEDRMLAALLAGILGGVGSGLILRSWGSSGGTDILSVIMLKRFSLSLGSTVLIFNGAVLAAAALAMSLEGALYTLVHIAVTARIMDLVVLGLSQRKAVFIISARWREIAEGILHEINRGATILEGQGGFSGQTEHIIYTVVTFRELAAVKQLTRAMDPEAFLVVSDTQEVMGRRIGNQPHW
ncbi:MAG: YitT family protein [Desulfarculus sp.]|nr:YitT family protein [Desulfarculus sp.]